MKTCDACGNKYEAMLEVKRDGKTYHFDCFECAIHALAPECPTCGVKVIGHGVEAEGRVYCGANCAHRAGVEGINVRV